MGMCLTCGYTNVPGTLFCEGCGSALTPEAQGRSAASGGAAAASVAAPAARFSTGDVPHAPSAATASEGIGADAAFGGAAVATAETAEEARSFFSWEGAHEVQGAQEAQDRPEPALEREGAPEPPAQPAAPAPALAAYLISDTGRRVDVPAQDVSIVGREDARSGIRPDVDLTLDGASAAGVSRRHCRLLRQADGWYVEDLMSTNYTVLNGQALAPHVPTRVQHGDQIRLGKLRLTFHEA